MPYFRYTLQLLLLMLATLAGCASYVPKPLSAQATATAFAARSLSAPGLEQYLQAHSVDQVPPDTWNLNRLTLAALYYHPDLAVARAQQDVAEAGLAISRQRPNPSLNFTPGYNADTIAGMSPWIWGLMLNFPIDTAGRRGYMETQADFQRDAARFHVAEMAWQIRSQVRSRMLDEASALGEVDILRQTLQLRTSLLHAMQRSLAAGEAGRPEVEAAESAQADTQLQLQMALGRAVATRVALAAAVGVPVAALDHVKISFDMFNRPLSVAQIPTPAVRRAALTNRADLLAALALYAASQSALQLEIARQYPDLQIGPGYKWDQGANKWSLGINLTLPLFNQNQGQIAQAKAQRELAAMQFIALQTRDIEQSERALAGYRAALATLDAAQSAVTVQHLRVTSAQRQLLSGYTSRSAVDEAQLQYLAAETTRLNAVMQAQQQLGALEDAIAHPLDGAIEIRAKPDPAHDVPANKGFQP